MTHHSSPTKEEGRVRVSPAGASKCRSAFEIFFLYVVFAAAGGCASWPLGKSRDSADKPIAAAKKADEQKQETLSEVEDFLARTQQYSKPSARVADAPPPTLREFLDATNKSTPGAKLPDTQKVTSIPPVDRSVANSQVAIASAPPPKPALAIPALQSVTVKSNDPAGTESTKATPDPANAANTALDTRSMEDSLWDRLLKELSAQAEKKKDADSQWRLRMAQLAADRDTDATKALNAGPADSQATLAAFVETAKSVRDAVRDATISNEAAASLDKLRESLTEKSDPTIRSIALCRKVTTFGAFDEMTKEDFLAGRSTQTIIYCEVEHLRPQRTGDGQFQTRLATRLEVLTPEGKSIWQRQEPEILDACRQRRRDFFIAQRITLPATLPPGDYVLKVAIEDKVSNRTGEATHSFTIVAPMSVAKGG